jgi:hypothetical protein
LVERFSLEEKVVGSNPTIIKHYSSFLSKINSFKTFVFDGSFFMGKDQILTETIKIAIKNGWELGNEWPRFEVILAGVGFWEGPEPHYAHIQDLIGSSPHVKYSVEEIIFSHSFAKAFFGEKEIKIITVNRSSMDDLVHIGGLKHTIIKKMDGLVGEVYMIAWQYHLQQMVISKDPIKYLEKFI